MITPISSLPMNFKSKNFDKGEMLKNFYDKKIKYDFLVGDIESPLSKDSQFVFGVGVVFDGKYFHESYNIDDYFSVIQSLKIKNIYFHNLNFDFIFFLRGVFLGEDITMVQSGNMILQVKCKGVTFKNSLSILPMSLKKVVRNFLQIDWYDWENEKTNVLDLDKSTLVEYCKKDCYLTFLALQKVKNLVYNEYGIKKFLTLPSLALKIYNKKYIGDVHDDIFSIKNRNSFFNDGYYFGGHTEKFIKNVYYFDRVEYYDVNSLYPDRMNDVEIHHGELVMTHPSKEKIEKSLNDGDIFFADITFNVDCEKSRVLPSLEIDSNFYKMGVVRCKVSHLTLEYFKEIGKLDNIIEIHSLLYPQTKKKSKIFKDFVQDFYSFRKSKKENNEIFKRLLVSLYGKYGQKTEIKTHIINNTKREDYSKFITHDEKNYIYMFDDQLQNSSITYSRKDIAGKITESARLKMARYRNLIHDAGGVVYYQDTDSLMVNKELNFFGLDGLVDNSKLGFLKKENSKTLSGYIIGQKIYYFSEKHKASKGVKVMNRQQFKNLSLSVIITRILEGEIKITHFIEKSKTICLKCYPNSSFYNTRFTQYKTFMKKGFFGIQIVPHTITNVRERLDGLDKNSKIKIFNSSIKKQNS